MSCQCHCTFLCVFINVCELASICMTSSLIEDGPSFSSWKRLFMEEAKLQALRFSDAKRPAFSLCIDSLA
jgi:hypothetical protein